MPTRILFEHTPSTMFGTVFASALGLMALYCAGMGYAAWRNPTNWFLNSDTKRVEFHAWLDIGIFAVIGAICLGMAALIFAF